MNGSRAVRGSKSFWGGVQQAMPTMLQMFLNERYRQEMMERYRRDFEERRRSNLAMEERYRRQEEEARKEAARKRAGVVSERTREQGAIRRILEMQPGGEELVRRFMETAPTTEIPGGIPTPVGPAATTPPITIQDLTGIEMLPGLLEKPRTEEEEIQLNILRERLKDLQEPEESKPPTTQQQMSMLHSIRAQEQKIREEGEEAGKTPREIGADLMRYRRKIEAMGLGEFLGPTPPAGLPEGYGVLMPTGGTPTARPPIGEQLPPWIDTYVNEMISTKKAGSREEAINMLRAAGLIP